jgi:starch synthase
MNGSYTAVHLVAEYWPFAQAGGLAEAVRGMARFQSAAGLPTVAILPLYRVVRERFPKMEAYGEPFQIPIGSRKEEARLFRADTDPGAPGGEAPEVYFIQSDAHFDRPGIYGESSGDYPDNHRRFALFSRAALHVLPRIAPNGALLHAHDWHAAWAIVYLRTVLAGDPYCDAVPTVMSVHNAGYQGHFPFEVLADVGLPTDLFHFSRMEWYGRVNVLKGGLNLADMATTVSAGHAHELRTRAGGFGLDETFIALQDRFAGIPNGIDEGLWNPAHDTEIAARYDRDHLAGKAECKRWLQDACGFAVRPEIPLVAMVARMVQQKGMDLILAADFLHAAGGQFVFLGSGDARYEEALAKLGMQFPERIAVRFDFTHARERQLLGGADVLLMPSLYEPCGLTQMRAQRYGTLPVARRVGGLADTIEDQVTGFLFDAFEPAALERGLRRAFGLFTDRNAWEWHMREAMSRDFSWERSVAKYMEVYGRARARRSRAA